MGDFKGIGIMRPRPTKTDRPAANPKVEPRAGATVEGDPWEVHNTKLERAARELEGDLGRSPTALEFILDAPNIGERLKAAEVADHNAHLEGCLAKTEIRVNGARVVLSKIRTQEHAGLLLAEATREQMDAESHYRAWRARLGLELVTKAKKEVPEWRVRQLIESEPNYLTYRTAIARAAANVLALKAVWETWGDE